MSRSANLRPRRLDAAYLATSVARRTGHIVGIAEKTVGPLLDLLIRLWLAQIFWASGRVELQNWTGTLLLSTHQYPLSWLDPITATRLVAAIELIGPPLLVVGLATRFAALPMLILSLVIQFSYQAHSVDHRRDCDPNALDYPIIHRRFAFANRGWYCAGG